MLSFTPSRHSHSYASHKNNMSTNNHSSHRLKENQSDRTNQNANKTAMAMESELLGVRVCLSQRECYCIAIIFVFFLVLESIYSKDPPD